MGYNTADVVRLIRPLGKNCRGLILMDFEICILEQEWQHRQFL